MNSSNVRNRMLSKIQEMNSDGYDFTDDVYANKSRKIRPLRVKRRNYDDDHDDNNREILPKWKIAIVIAAICICFALVFPTVFSPLINSLWGTRGSGAESSGSNKPRHAPPIGGRSTPSSRGGPVHPQMHMPPPNARAGIDAAASRGRGGVFTWMMPFYTIGVVGFLGYTLYKIMFKKKNRRKCRQHYDSDESDSDADDGELNGQKLRMVQKRLLKTEAAMREIIQQLENIADATNVVDTRKKSTTPLDDLSNKKKEEEINDNIHLTKSQEQEIQRGLQQLRQLSDLYMQQRREIDEDYNGEEHYSSQSVASDEDCNANYESLIDKKEAILTQKNLIPQCEKNKRHVKNSQSSYAHREDSYENLDSSEENGANNDDRMEINTETVEDIESTRELKELQQKDKPLKHSFKKQSRIRRRRVRRE